jgi:hypothetical protein
MTESPQSSRCSHHRNFPVASDDVVASACIFLMMPPVTILLEGTWIIDKALPWPALVSSSPTSTSLDLDGGVASSKHDQKRTV